MNISDELIQKIREKNNPTVVGLDPFIEQFPPQLVKGRSKAEVAESILAFNKAIIDAVYDIVPAVKPQLAFYEQYGWQGFKALEDTVRYAKSRGLFVILDAKRNDIGSTAAGYAQAYLTESSFNADAITVNGYLGSDGIKPFLDTGRMIFVLVKTSNPSSGELQDRKLDDGKTIYETMANLCATWGGDGKPYNNVGIVVGATYPEQIAELRTKLPNTFFLIPGYGTQGGKASDIAKAFDKDGLGAIVNASRSILYAWKKKESSNGEDFAELARAEAIKMKEDLNNTRV